MPLADPKDEEAQNICSDLRLINSSLCHTIDTVPRLKVIPRLSSLQGTMQTPRTYTVSDEWTTVVSD